MAEKNNISQIMETAIEEIRSMVDADTVIGKPIIASNITIIPVSKITFGIASGGVDLKNKNNASNFGGGGGAGVTVVPICFLAVSGENVRILNINNSEGIAEKAVSLVPELFDKIKALFKNQKNDTEVEEIQ